MKDDVSELNSKRNLKIDKSVSVGPVRIIIEEAVEIANEKNEHG